MGCLGPLFPEREDLHDELSLGDLLLLVLLVVGHWGLLTSQQRQDSLEVSNPQLVHAMPCFEGVWKGHWVFFWGMWCRSFGF